MVYKCYCYSKINLYLDVVEKREDGFHNIISLFQCISLHDSIYLELMDGNPKDVIFKSNDVSLKWNEKNSIFRAFKEFQSVFGSLDKGMRIFVKKRIPKACGLGGESSDAAGMLLLLAKLKEVEVKEILELAENVGSDVKFFLIGGTALVRGRGELIKKLNSLKNWSVDLRIPPFYFKTPEMYKLIDENAERIVHKGNALELYSALKNKDIEKIKQNLFNVFEQVAILNQSDIVAYKDSDFSCMTGSGPAFYILRENKIGRYVFVEGGNKIEEINKEISGLW
ncbi:MAG TPA: 4-(cytidine 5'-diphospho)-2-C-methyl-D-erythritol kinase [Thermotogaceae bacterium]|nr:4-(cytidine 5'-diphospho)-2-C-methyl-D-erythritol kinase [Thermotogaceae bacterium]